MTLTPTAEYDLLWARAVAKREARLAEARAAYEAEVAAAERQFAQDVSHEIVEAMSAKIEAQAA